MKILNFASAWILASCLTVFSTAPLHAGEQEHFAPAKILFDGVSLTGWQVTDFDGHGAARVESGRIILEKGAPLSGINFTNAVPLTNYEISLEARKVEGNDFFCGLTFPVAGTNCTLILGGWGGNLAGISSIDELDASENVTGTTREFTAGRWYQVRLRVAHGKMEAWLDSEPIVDFKIEDHKLGLRPGPIEKSVPLGIATYQTKAEFRNIRLVQIPPQSLLK